jgi:hypothetical protein
VSEIPGGEYVFYRSGGTGFDIDRLYAGVTRLKVGQHCAIVPCGFSR